VREPALAGSFWPAPAQKLLLQAVLLDGAAGEEAWARTRPGFDLDMLEPGSFCLMPLLYRRLERGGSDDPLLPRLKGMYRRTWYVNQLRLDQLLPALSALDPVGADVLVVDGWELAERYYGDRGLRPVRGLHVFVRPEHVTKSLQALDAAGWTSDFEPSESGLRSRHSVWLTGPADQACILHWRPFHEFVSPKGALDDLWSAALDFRLADTPARALCASDELLNICLSGARSSHAPNVQWLADAVTLIRTAGTEIEWQRVVNQATSRRATLRLRDALVYLRDVLAVPVPVDVVEELEQVSVNRRERLAHRAGAWSGSFLGVAPESLTRYLRATAGSSVPRTLAELPAFLRDEWGLERRSQVPMTAALKAGARLTRSARALARAGR
jgi:hypothetical protein